MTLYTPTTWAQDYARDFVGFCRNEMMMLPTPPIEQALRSLARYKRVGFAEPIDFPFEQITGAVVIWRMLTLYESHHILLAANNDDALLWFKICEQMMGVATPRLRAAILFSRTGQPGMTTTDSRNLRCAYLEHKFLKENIPTWVQTVPLTVVCSDLDHLPTSRINTISKMLTHEDCLWVGRTYTASPRPLIGDNTPPYNSNTYGSNSDDEPLI